MPDINRIYLPEFHPMTELQDWSAISPGLKFCIEDAKTHVAIFGATGSGKSSGPGKHIASTYLANDFGILVLCAKPEERITWQKWAAAHGRLTDVRVVDASGNERFNFLDWEASQPFAGGGLTINIVALLDELAGAIAGNAGSSADSGGDNKFFEDALHHMNMNLVDLQLFAGLPVSLPLMRAIVNTAPQSLQEAQSDEWKNGEGECAAMLRRAEALVMGADAPDADKVADFEECRAYWTQEVANLSEKTRSIITLSFSMLVRPFLTRPLRKIFSTDTTLTPEDVFDGKIVIIDLCTQDLRLTGRVANLVWKYCFQVAVLRRKQPPAAPKGHEELQEYLRPAAVFWDEGHNFALKRFDALWHSAARAAAGCSVMLVQTREALRTVLGNNDEVETLLSNFQIKFFGQSSSVSTNDFASTLIGERWVEQHTTNVHGQQGAGGVSMSEQRRRWVEPSRFTTLKRGGPRNNYHVQAICYNGGNEFLMPGKDGEMVGTPCALFTFDQRK